MNISMADATCRHEAAHAAAAIWLGGRTIRCVRVDEPDLGVPGKMTAERERDLRPEDLIVNLVGWMADGECPGTWPPTWPVAEDTAEGVGVLVKRLGLDEAGYREIVGLAEKLLANPDFQRLMLLVARALHLAPVIDGESVEILRKAAGVPTHPTEGALPCST
jgi:hypothetical protein